MKIGILGASGYVGGELLRLLISHPDIEVTVITSRKFDGDYLHRVHPNLSGALDLKFVSPSISKISDSCDFLFVAMPHGESLKILPEFLETGLRIIDTSADFRLKNLKDYEIYYRWEHPIPELLKIAVYGLPEIHRKDIRKANLVSCPGCMAASSILALAPIIKGNKIEKNRIIIDAKMGSSGAGTTLSLSTHHAEHFNIVRPYKPVGHRHTPEIEQELSNLAGERIKIAMSAHSVNMVRGVLVTCHTFIDETLTITDIWRAYREFYRGEPFIRFVRDRRGVFRFPDPKIVVGSNFCDIGFEIDNQNNRLVVISALDNLVKGAAGTAVQNMNIMMRLNERAGLEHLGLHPV
jgi:N-acetyl-gamma-glutamyl-phosphate/LysW-gamma-L-alpha-aminoadipyl-6-phosphate reductase